MSKKLPNRVTVRVPGSTSNCGSGFDSLGLALSVYNDITLARGDWSGARPLTDRDTAGLVLFTIQPQVRDAYQRMFRDRTVDKHYEAVASVRADHVFPTTRRSRLIESAVGKKAILNHMPMQAGDVAETSADTADLLATVGFKPSTPLADGIRRYVDWHRAYHKV